MRSGLRRHPGRASLAAIHQLVAFKAGVFTGLTNQGENRQEHLRSEEDQ